MEDRALLGIGGGQRFHCCRANFSTRMNYETSAFIFETGDPGSVGWSTLLVRWNSTVKVRHLLDPQVFQAYDGRRSMDTPFSAMVAWVGYLAAALYGYRYVVVGNERSSNIGNVEYLARQ